MEHDLIVVSDEVGQGVVPATVAGRRFRDELGRVNQLVARDAATVTVVVAGIPVAIKAVT